MKSKKLTVAVFIAIALIFSFGVAVEKASADAIMFPWLVKSPSVISLLSVVNTSDVSTTCRFDSNPAMLHYQYWYKPNDLTTACGEIDQDVRTSENDLIVFDAAGTVDTLPLFHDTPGKNNLVIYNGGNPTMDSAPTPSRAFLLVDNNDEPKEECFENAWDASLYGEALILELNNGAGWGYVAYNGKGAGPDGPNSEPTLGFQDGADLQGEVLRSPRYFDSAASNELEATPIVLLPLNVFKTKIFMTPANYAMNEFDSGPGARTGQANARLQFCYNPNAAGTFPVGPTCAVAGALTQTGDSCQSNGAPVCQGGGIFDNDERPLSSTLKLNVVCTAAQDISEVDKLLNQGQINYLTTFGGAAWTYVRSMVGDFYPADGNGARSPLTESDMIVGKLDYTESAFQINNHDGSGHTSIGGEVNDFKWIRNSGSQDCDSGTCNWDLSRGINQVIQDDAFGD